MLDQKDGDLILLAHQTDRIHQLSGFVGVHAGGRLIQKQKLRFGCKRTGNFQFTLFAIGQVGCQRLSRILQPEDSQDLHGTLGHFFFFFVVASHM